MKQRILPFVLALTLCLGLAAPAWAAEEAPQRGVITYTEVIAPQYEDAGLFSEGLAAVKKDGKWGYIDTENNVVIPFRYDWACDFWEGYALVATFEVEGWDDVVAQVGFIDHENNYTPFMYSGYGTVENLDTDYAGPLYLYASSLTDKPLYFYHGIVYLNGDLFTTDGNQVVVSTGDWFEPGAEVIPNVTGPFNEGLIPLELYTDTGKLVGYVNKDGVLVQVFEPQYFGEVYYVDIGGEEPVAAQDYTVMESVMPFNQGLAVARLRTYYGDETTLPGYGVWTQRWGFLKKDYTWAIEPQYLSGMQTNAESRAEVFGITGLAMMMDENRIWGAINKKGETVIPFQYEDLRAVMGGMIEFKKDGKYGYLDAATNQVAIEAQYENVTGFGSYGYAVVYDGEKAFLIDRKGEPIPGSEQVDPDSYFIQEQDGTVRIQVPGEYVIIEADGKYGFGRIGYTPKLPEKSEMSDWAYDEVVAAIEAGLVPTGQQVLYHYNINRHDFCALTLQLIETVLDQDIEDVILERTGRTLTDWVHDYPFTDEPEPIVIAAYALGIVNGKGKGTFAPYNSITRQEAAAMLTRTAKVLGMDTENPETVEFADGDKVADYFVDEVNFVASNGIMNGTGKNKFNPRGTYTREQTMLTMLRLFKKVTE